MHNGCKEYSDREPFIADNQGARGEGGISGFLRTHKPRYSPNVRKWLNNGGKIEINGNEWKYKKVLDDVNLYYATYDSSGKITFSPDSFFRINEFAEVNIMNFTGTRSGDIQRNL